MEQILFSDWLLVWATKAHLQCLIEIFRVGPTRKSSLFDHSINVFIDLDFVSVYKNAKKKKELGQ